MWGKKSKCPKKNFQSVERKKNVSVEFRVFGKKMKIERKVLGENQSGFFFENLKWKILLSSYSLVGLYVSLQVKVTGKNDENLQSVFHLGVFEV